MAKRAAIYARVSSPRQAGDDRVSIDVQLADCRKHCEERGYHVVAEYVDKASYRVRGKLVRPSGARKDRPGYLALLNSAAAGELDVIVAWKEDRLYRGLYAALPFSEVLDEHGAALDVELVMETFDRKMLGIKAAMGKLELDNIRERMIMGRRARLERGELPGGDQVKYGYRRAGKQLEIDEREAGVVRKVFGMYIAGESIKGMCEKLNASGIPPRRAKRWGKSAVQRITASEFYATGELETTLDGETYTIPCPTIISLETWRRSLDVRARNKAYSRPRNLKEDYLLAGMVYCACGYKLQAIAGKRKNAAGGRYGIYRCQRRYASPDDRPANCAGDTGTGRVDRYVWNYVKRLCENPALVREGMARRLAALEEEQAGLDGEIARLERELDELASQRQWVISQARVGNITDEDMKHQLTELQVAQLVFQKELDERQGEAAARTRLEAAQAWADQYLQDIGADLASLELEPDELDDEERAHLYRELEAWKYAEKFPDDELAQLRWAQLEERRRAVRTLISHVEIARKGKRGREIRPFVRISIPGESLASGDQSLSYVENARSMLEEINRTPGD